MIFDHVAMIFFPYFVNLRLPGRIALPLFCFFAGYNASKHIRYLILFWGIVMSFLHYLIFGDLAINLLVTIFFGKLLLRRLQTNPKPLYIQGLFILCIAVSFIPFTHYLEASMLPVAFMLVGYVAKLRRSYMLMLILSLLGLIAFMPFIFLRFGIPQYAITSVLFIFTAILLNLDFNKKIAINCNLVSRNLLTVYVGHMLVIAVIYILMML